MSSSSRHRHRKGTPKANGAAVTSSQLKPILEHKMSSVPEETTVTPTNRTSSDPSKRHNNTPRSGTGTRSAPHRHHVAAPTQSKSKDTTKVERRPNSTNENHTYPGNHNFNCNSNNNSASSARKDASTQTEYSKRVVFELKLKKNVRRSLQNPTMGNLERAKVGTGRLRVLECKMAVNTHYMCQLIGDDGALKFQAIIPNSQEAHKSMHLNFGVANSFCWNAYDFSGETKLRSYVFRFSDGHEMFATLLHFFGGSDLDIVNEFYRGEGGRFVPEKEKLPPHSIVRNEDDMDVNSDDEEHAVPPLSKEQEAHIYGYVEEESMFF